MPPVITPRCTRYAIALEIVDRPVLSHQHCQLCQSLGSVIEVELYLPIEAGDGHLDHKHLECCCACVISAIDDEDRLASDQLIRVEVYRGCTLRALS